MTPEARKAVSHLLRARSAEDARLHDQPPGAAPRPLVTHLLSPLTPTPSLRLPIQFPAVTRAPVPRWDGGHAAFQPRLLTRGHQGEPREGEGRKPWVRERHRGSADRGKFRNYSMKPQGWGGKRRALSPVPQTNSRRTLSFCLFDFFFLSFFFLSEVSTVPGAGALDSGAGFPAPQPERTPISQTRSDVPNAERPPRERSPDRARDSSARTTGPASAAPLCARQGRSRALRGRRGGASTHRPRTSASWSGSSGPWRRPAPRRRRRLQLPGPGPPPRRAPARPGLLRHVPANLAGPASRPPAAPPRTALAPARPRPAVTCWAGAAPGGAPPRPLPPAAPSARPGPPPRPDPRAPGLSRPPRGSALFPAPPRALPGSGCPGRLGSACSGFCFFFFPLGVWRFSPPSSPGLNPGGWVPGGVGRGGGAGPTQAGGGRARSAGSPRLSAPRPGAASMHPPAACWAPGTPGAWHSAGAQ